MDRRQQVIDILRQKMEAHQREMVVWAHQWSWSYPNWSWSYPNKSDYTSFFHIEYDTNFDGERRAVLNIKNGGLQHIPGDLPCSIGWFKCHDYIQRLEDGTIDPDTLLLEKLSGD